MKIKNIVTGGCLSAVLLLMAASCAGSSDSDKTTAESEVAQAVEEVPAAGAVTKIKADGQIPPAEGKLIVLDFNATWCGPCRQFAPNFEKVADSYSDRASFYSIDVDENPGLAAQYNVESIPMIVYIRPDGTTTSSVGYMDEAQFATAVEAALK